VAIAAGESMKIAQDVLGLIFAPGVWGADWAWGAPLIVLTVVLHVFGLGTINLIAVRAFTRKRAHYNPAVLVTTVVSTVTWLATCLHAVEAAMWAFCYQLLGARADFKSAMLYSLGAMTTFGHASVYLEDRWQLMGAIEALNGWLLFGLTTAFLFSAIQKCYEIANDSPLLRSESPGRQS